MKWIIPILVNIAIISAQVDQSCVLPSTSTITIGQTNYICAKIIYQNSTYFYSFPIKVDKITVLSLKDLSSFITNKTNSTVNITSNISISLQFQNSKDAIELLLSNQEKPVYRNLISVVIRVNNGIFSEIINDSQDCSECNTGPNICYLDYCFNNGKFLGQSNLYIYVSWIGTDLNRHHMISYTQRLKKLSKFSFGNIYSQAFSIY